MTGSTKQSAPPSSLRAERSNPTRKEESVDCFVASLLAMTARCGPTGRAIARPVTRREAIHAVPVIASGAKQSKSQRRNCGLLRRFAPRNDGALRANGLGECAPDDRLHEAIHAIPVIASGAKQSNSQRTNCGLLRRFAPRNDGALRANGLGECAPDDRL